MAAATTATTADSPFDRLSAGLLQQVLQGVPQRERLTQCALVSRAWAEAAALATSEVDCTVTHPLQTRRLNVWLRKHAGQLRSLAVRGDGNGSYNPLILPSPLLKQLQVLSVTRITIALDSNSVPATVSAQLPRLREVELVRCNIMTKLLLQLASSPQLTSFRVDSLAVVERTSQPGVCADLCAALQKERQQPLIVLQLRGLAASPAVLQHVHSMHSLQELELSIEQVKPSGDIADLPLESLTRLVLSERVMGVSAQLLQAPKMQQLTSLQHLKLDRCTLDPSALASIPQLRVLGLEWCILLPDHPKGAAALLRSLQHLTGLQCLETDGARLGSATQLQLSSALTASASHLTRLALNEVSAQPLPTGALAQMLAEGRQLPALQELVIEYEHSGEGQNGWCLDSGDLAAIVSACPALADLDITGAVRGGADVSALSRLPPSCQRLVIGGDGFGEAAASTIAQLSQLTYLCWSHSPSLSDIGLQQLTALRALDRLNVYECDGISRELRRIVMDPMGEEEVDFDDFELELFSSGHKGLVWKQLARICDKSTVCLRAQLRLQGVQIEAQQEEIERLQLEVQQLRGQLAERDAKLSDRDAR